MSPSDHLLDRFHGFNSGGQPRLNKQKENDHSERTPTERDVDRLRYTRELRRLKDVTQVARAGETYLYHDRLSHSLKVAQVGRRFAEHILRVQKSSGILENELDPDMVEAACLAHDLGHPPFGHLAETTLDKLLQEKTNPYLDTNALEPSEVEDIPEEINEADDYDEYARITGVQPPGLRFEGNAQAFRILTRTANHRDVDTGLGLTVGVLNGIQKYPYGRGEWISDELEEWHEELDRMPGRSGGKFGYYKTEEPAFNEIRENIPDEVARTITAAIMDYADDLTYAIHDLTDFYMDGRVPLDRLLREAFEEENPEGEYESAKRRELEKLDAELDYDSSTVTPTQVITSLVATMFSTTEELLLFEPFDGSPQQRDEIEEFTSFLVEEYLNRVFYKDRTEEELREDEDIQRYVIVKENDRGAELVVSEVLKQHIDILQQITKYYVIRQPPLMGQQRGQRELVKELFGALYEEASKSDLSWSAIPKPYRNWLSDDELDIGAFQSSEAKRARVIADFIATMTEPQAIELHKRLTGDTPGSLQDEIVR